MSRLLPYLIILCALAASTSHAEQATFGEARDALLTQRAMELFGIQEPLVANTPSSGGFMHRQVGQVGSDLVVAAKGLQVEIVSRVVGQSASMLAPWPHGAEEPTHMMLTIGGRQGYTSSGKLRASVQSVDLATGEVRTILRGLDRANGIRATAWGTLLVTESVNDGAAYEILDPLHVHELSVIDRETGEIQDANGVVVTSPARKLASLPTMSWEGVAVLDNGVVYAGDEHRPDDHDIGSDVEGGSLFKFVPERPALLGLTISQLEDSPLVSGSTFALAVSCIPRSSAGFPQYGQGCQTGQGAWVKVDPASARRDAFLKGATGYYRPRDMRRDTRHAGPGVRLCVANAGNVVAENFAEVLCVVDHYPLGDGRQGTVKVNVQEYQAVSPGTMGWATVGRFVLGDASFNSMDDLAFQPGTGNLFVVEEQDGGDIWTCLPDGPDRDLESDGCVRVLTVQDGLTQPTGLVFTNGGRVAYVNLRRNEGALPSLHMTADGFGTDDLLRITGWKVPAASAGAALRGDAGKDASSSETEQAVEQGGGVGAVLAAVQDTKRHRKTLL